MVRRLPNTTRRWPRSIAELCGALGCPSPPILTRPGMISGWNRRGGRKRSPPILPHPGFLRPKVSDCGHRSSPCRLVDIISPNYDTTRTFSVGQEILTLASSLVSFALPFHRPAHRPICCSESLELPSHGVARRVL